jgi:hypothetical protein
LPTTTEVVIDDAAERPVRADEAEMSTVLVSMTVVATPDFVIVVVPTTYVVCTCAELLTAMEVLDGMAVPEMATTLDVEVLSAEMLVAFVLEYGGLWDVAVVEDVVVDEGGPLFSAAFEVETAVDVLTDGDTELGEDVEKDVAGCEDDTALLLVGVVLLPSSHITA